MKLFHEDWIQIVTRIQKKKRDRGFTNRDIDLKIKKIELKLNLIKKAARNAANQAQNIVQRLEQEKIDREKIRNFIFEEFMKKDPDQISFERPDSGSGISGEDEDASDQEEDDEQFSDEEDLKLME